MLWEDVRPFILGVSNFVLIAQSLLLVVDFGWACYLLFNGQKSLWGDAREVFQTFAFAYAGMFMGSAVILGTKHLLIKLTFAVIISINIWFVGAVAQHDDIATPIVRLFWTQFSAERTRCVDICNRR